MKLRQKRGMAATLHTKRYAQQPGLYRNYLRSTEDNIPGPYVVFIRMDDASNVGPLEKPNQSADE